jgi:hypothetical protein
MSAIKANQVLNLDGDRIGSVVVDSIANMKNLNTEIEANATVEVLGYHSKGDGGGGTFYWDSTSIEDDNGGTIIEATGVVDGRYIRNYSGAVNVKWFGAKGDGVTNDLTYIMRLNSVITDWVNIYIPYGEYNLDFTGYLCSPVVPIAGGILDVSNKDNVTIYGEGHLVITALDSRLVGGWSIIYGTACTDITIQGLTLELRDSTTVGQGIIGLDTYEGDGDYPIFSCIAFANDVHDITVRGCKILSFNKEGATDDSGVTYKFKQIPVFVTGTATASDTFTFDNNIMRDINTYKIFTHKVNNTRFTNNRFENLRGRYPTIRNLMIDATNHVYTGNYFKGALTSEDDASNSIVAADLPAHILLDATTNDENTTLIANNTFNLTNAGGINVNGCFGAIIESNVFYDRADMTSEITVVDSSAGCIWLQDNDGIKPRNIQVDGNTVNGAVARVFVTHSNGLNCSIINNTVDSARGYAINAGNPQQLKIANNNIADVADLSGTQVAIQTSLSGLTTSEVMIIENNTVHDFAGTGIQVNSYTTDKIIVRGNNIKNVTTETYPAILQTDDIKGATHHIYKDSIISSYVIPPTTLAAAEVRKIAKLTGYFNATIHLRSLYSGSDSGIFVIKISSDSAGVLSSFEMSNSFGNSTRVPASLLVVGDGVDYYLAVKGASSNITSIANSSIYGTGFTIEDMSVIVPTTTDATFTLSTINTGHKVNLNRTDVYARDEVVFGNDKGTIADINGLYTQTDNDYTLGSASKRWSTVYSGTGTINTSDDREKTYLDISTAEKNTALEIKANMKKFKFNDAIESKGLDGARIHFGASAQTVKAIFEKHGLVAEDYAILCYDEWEAEYEQVVITDAVLDEDGTVITPAVTENGTLISAAGNRYGLRYEELLSFIIGEI